jgi:hypothetical protein
MGTSNHDTPKTMLQYSTPLGNMNKHPHMPSTNTNGQDPKQETGAGVPAPGTYAPGTGPTVRPEWTGIRKG